MKKILYTALAAVLCFSLCACGTTYEDTNGENDYTLQTITDENIIHLETGSSGLSYSEFHLGDVTFSKGYSAKNFNGVDQLYTTNYLLPSTVTVYIGTLNISQGNFRLVALNNDEIIYDFPLDAFNETFTFENITGNFSIHLAGESAAFEFYIDIN